MSDFIHLRLHTDHSLLEGSVRVKKLPGAALEKGFPAIAVTNKNTMFDALQFSVGAYEAGVQPILGCQVTIKDENAKGSLVLLAKDEKGWLSLSELSAKIWLRKGGDPHLTISEVCEMSEGVICLTGGADGPLGRHILEGHPEKASALASRLLEAYGDRLYVELQRHPDENGRLTSEEEITEPRLIDIAYDMGIPLVATNDVRFLDKKDYEAHDALICVGDKAFVDQAEPRRRFTPEHYLKSPEEMTELFSDLPEAVENTVEIARRSAFAAYKRKPILPKFADDEVEELRRQAKAGLKERLDVIPLAVSREEYEKRLDYELSVIENMGFPGYFLIVADFIKWAKDEGIPVGPGRGSGAGSLVAYALTITDLDPIRYGLLFERFLNPDRVSMPDFDIDFCMDRREEVIRYVSDKYGSDRVGQIATFGAMLSKAAIRDVGRVLQLPFGRVDGLSKMIPLEGVKPVSISKARTEEARIEEEAKDPEIRTLLDHAENLEGVFRNASTHAAGVVIADRPLQQLVPVYRDEKSDMQATQFNMKWAEAAGLVKFDFLGLKTLTVIRKALDYVKESGVEIDISRIPVDDVVTFDLFASANTVAVFQVESAGMMDALRRMRPTCIEDIIALVALYRPGPMENIPTYCEVKNGLRPITSIHPLIDEILEETQGIIVYQEQVMEVARKMAGYTLGGADLLRRAMGKKIREEMDKERPKFVTGAVANGVEERKAGEVFDLLQKFADYGFNKSHAAAYALIAYQTAWLKANYPAEFMAAVMDCDAHLTDKLSVYRAECIRMGIEVASPSINLSEQNFVVKEGRIYYALAALKGVGEKSVVPIVEERRVNGPYADMADLARRVDLTKVGKTALESMVRAGAFDDIEPSRADALARVEPAMKMSREARKEKNLDLFAGQNVHGNMSNEKITAVAKEQWSGSVKFANEAISVGFYLSGHPLDDRAQEIQAAGIKTYKEIEEDNAIKDGTVQLAATVISLEIKKKYGFLKLSDPGGNYEVMIFRDMLDARRDLLKPGTDVLMKASVQRDAEGIRLTIRNVEPLTLRPKREKRQGKPKAAPKEVKAGSARIMIENSEPLAMIAKILGSEGENRGPVVIRIPTPGEFVDITVSESGNLTQDAIEELRKIPGIVIETEARAIPVIRRAAQTGRPEPAEPRFGL